MSRVHGCFKAGIVFYVASLLKEELQWPTLKFTSQKISVFLYTAGLITEFLKY